VGTQGFAALEGASRCDVAHVTRAKRKPPGVVSSPVVVPVMPMVVLARAGDGRGGDREHDARSKDVGQFLHFDLEGMDKLLSILRVAMPESLQEKVA
jgi:hypothetical protein